MNAAAIEETIFGLLARRQAGATLCPSEVARAVTPLGSPWRPRMPEVREVAARLAAQGRLVVTRAGRPVDATRPGGPLRLGLP